VKTRAKKKISPPNSSRQCKRIILRDYVWVAQKGRRGDPPSDLGKFSEKGKETALGALWFRILYCPAVKAFSQIGSRNRRES